MSEAWAVAFAGFAFTALAWGVNRIASKLDDLTDKLNSISASLASYVKDADCDDAMNKHCRRIEKLEKTVDKHTQAISILEDKTK